MSLADGAFAEMAAAFCGPATELPSWFRCAANTCEQESRFSPYVFYWIMLGDPLEGAPLLHRRGQAQLKRFAPELDNCHVFLSQG